MSVWLMSRFGKFLSCFVARSPMRFRLFLGDVLGLLWFDVLRIRRRIALENMARAFPEWTTARRVSVARWSLRNMGRGLTDFTIFPFFDQRTVSRYFVFEGLENLERALLGKRGVLFLSLHLGNGDFGVAALSRLGYKVNLISKVFKNRWLNDLWFGMRAKHGTRFIAPEKSSFEILKALKRNEIVIFVLDQFMGPPVGVRTRFFGHETGTAAGLAVIAERTGSPVLPVYSYRREDGRLVVTFEPPVEVGNLPSADADESLKRENITRMTQAYTDKLEEIIRRHPEQWMWIHKRWKEFRE